MPVALVPRASGAESHRPAMVKLARFWLAIIVRVPQWEQQTSWRQVVNLLLGLSWRHTTHTWDVLAPLQEYLGQAWHSHDNRERGVLSWMTESLSGPPLPSLAYVSGTLRQPSYDDCPHLLFMGLFLDTIHGLPLLRKMGAQALAEPRKSAAKICNQNGLRLSFFISAFPQTYWRSPGDGAEGPHLGHKHLCFGYRFLAERAAQVPKLVEAARVLAEQLAVEQRSLLAKQVRGVASVLADPAVQERVVSKDALRTNTDREALARLLTLDLRGLTTSSFGELFQEVELGPVPAGIDTLKRLGLVFTSRHDATASDAHVDLHIVRLQASLQSESECREAKLQQWEPLKAILNDEDALLASPDHPVAASLQTFQAQAQQHFFNVEKAQHIDDEYLALLSQLYRLKEKIFEGKKTCIRGAKCLHPAKLRASFRAAELDEHTQTSLSCNREEASAMLKDSSVTNSLCQAAHVLQQVVAELQSAPERAPQAWQLVQLMLLHGQGVVGQYAPFARMQQLVTAQLSSIIERPSELQLSIAQFCLTHPSASPTLLPLLRPPEPSAFVATYAALSKCLTPANQAVLDHLLTLFDVSAFLATHGVAEECVALQQALSEALQAAQACPAPSLVEKHQLAYLTCLAFGLPRAFSQSLSELLQLGRLGHGFSGAWQEVAAHLDRNPLGAAEADQALTMFEETFSSMRRQGASIPDVWGDIVVSVFSVIFKVAMEKQSTACQRSSVLSSAGIFIMSTILLMATCSAFMHKFCNRFRGHTRADPNRLAMQLQLHTLTSHLLASVADTRGPQDLEYCFSRFVEDCEGPDPHLAALLTNVVQLVDLAVRDNSQLVSPWLAVLSTAIGTSLQPETWLTVLSANMTHIQFYTQLGQAAINACLIRGGPAASLAALTANFTLPEVGAEVYLNAARHYDCTLVLWAALCRQQQMFDTRSVLHEHITGLSAVVYRQQPETEVVVVYWLELLAVLGRLFRDPQNYSACEQAGVQLRDHWANVAVDPTLGNLFARALASDSRLPHRLRLCARLIAYVLSLAFVEGNSLRLTDAGVERVGPSAWSRQSLSTLQRLQKGTFPHYAAYGDVVGSVLSGPSTLSFVQSLSAATSIIHTLYDSEVYVRHLSEA
ncbi:uncharacterized protein MONBRDRAFT_23495 [Monosiga brevicollis MX1]|uniref:Epg5-like central TPR repeats domain-containing protein n=1 Tax=Monosiga brevicollis TaxID=81824 RepID=A9UTK7_MONBE|nr:uncharacterized protein MONBRDRAFT_23495 [Monosiga brevicollis MX1]EDQ91511.1 predicted protein [Monosiga brevicollis MX1]|eukprot:XP_001743933.1 hypothetical protein [Monosiga brevicollis MX1]